MKGILGLVNRRIDLVVASDLVRLATTADAFTFVPTLVQGLRAAPEPEASPGPLGRKISHAGSVILGSVPWELTPSSSVVSGIVAVARWQIRRRASPAGHESLGRGRNRKPVGRPGMPRGPRGGAL